MAEKLQFHYWLTEDKALGMAGNFMAVCLWSLRRYLNMYIVEEARRRYIHVIQRGAGLCARRVLSSLTNLMQRRSYVFSTAWEQFRWRSTKCSLTRLKWKRDGFCDRRCTRCLSRFVASLSYRYWSDTALRRCVPRIKRRRTLRQLTVQSVMVKCVCFAKCISNRK